jgi:Zn finger protein HypA/HybF involved in hydrogenase expression
MKECKNCARALAASDFYSHPATADRLLAVCKQCHRADMRARRRLNGESIRAYDRSRGSRRTVAETRAWRAANPEKYRAQTAVGNAIRDGKLSKEPCLFCGEERVHAHHADYSEPLKVTWLCPKCHQRLHANFPDHVQQASA